MPPVRPRPGAGGGSVSGREPTPSPSCRIWRPGLGLKAMNHLDLIVEDFEGLAGFGLVEVTTGAGVPPTRPPGPPNGRAPEDPIPSPRCSVLSLLTGVENSGLLVPPISACFRLVEDPTDRPFDLHCLRAVWTATIRHLLPFQSSPKAVLEAVAEAADESCHSRLLPPSLGLGGPRGCTVLYGYLSPGTDRDAYVQLCRTEGLEIHRPVHQRWLMYWPVRLNP